MDIGRAIGIAVLVLGVVVLGFAYHFSEATMDQLSNTLTGRYSDTTMAYFIAGIAAVFGGCVLVLFGKRI